jgi:hypothetical protein
VQAGSTERVWRFAWLPLGPLAFSLLVARAEDWLADSVAAARQLRAQMYSYKEL